MRPDQIQSRQPTPSSRSRCFRPCWRRRGYEDGSCATGHVRWLGACHGGPWPNTYPRYWHTAEQMDWLPVLCWSYTGFCRYARFEHCAGLRRAQRHTCCHSQPFMYEASIFFHVLPYYGNLTNKTKKQFFKHSEVHSVLQQPRPRS